MSIKTVAILGAGPSGLVAAKEALENGLSPTIFEKQSELGGVWHPTTGAVWDSMHTNISKFTTAYGDTTYPSDTEMFPSTLSVVTYLNDYADKWGLRNLIKFRSQVVQVTPLDNHGPIGESGWIIKWHEGEDRIVEGIFSAVIVATGIFAKPSIPEVKGIETYPGKIIHSKEYKSGQEFKSFRVLTIGGSFSGVEIAADVANYAEKSIHSFRRPFWILKRYLPDGQRDNKKLPLDLLFYNRKFYDQAGGSQQALPDAETNVKKNTNMAYFCSDQQQLDSLKIPEEYFKNPINASVSDNYLPNVKENKLIPIRQTIKEIQESKILFENGEVVKDIGAIIFATGFQLDNSFFGRDVLEIISYDPMDRLQPLILFNESVHPDLKNLFFVGMYKGPYFAVMEQQARWACRVLSNRVALPSSEEMREELRKEKEIRDQNPRPQFPHPDYVLFADTVATCGGSFPDLEKLRSDKHTLAEAVGMEANNSSPSSKLKTAIFTLERKKDEIANRFMTEPVVPAHYNLVHDPKPALNQMDFVDQVVKQFL